MQQPEQLGRVQIGHGVGFAAGPADGREVAIDLQRPAVVGMAVGGDEDASVRDKKIRIAGGKPPAPVGETVARGINDGPDEDFEKARFVFLGALACARSSVRIMTPYFLPDAGLISALDVTALRGVRVEILLPEKNNLALVQWASTAQLWQVLHRGCRVYYSPPPFDHSKLMIVDGGWALFGSTNWDPRSLRLNFEFGVECYDTALVSELDALFAAKLAKSREVTAAEVNGRPLHIKLRDGVARLAAPYL